MFRDLARKLHDINPSHLLPRWFLREPTSVFSCFLLFFYHSSSDIIPRRLCPPVSLIFLPFLLFSHPPPAITDYRPTHARRTEKPLMIPPFMNTDYSSEVGVIKDYREQAPFCAGRWASTKEIEYKKHRGHFPRGEGEKGEETSIFFPPLTSSTICFPTSIVSLDSLAFRPDD